MSLVNTQTLRQAKQGKNCSRIFLWSDIRTYCVFPRNTAVVGVADMRIRTKTTYFLFVLESITSFCIVERKPHLATFPATSRTARPIPTSCTRWSVRSSGVDRNESAPATRPKAIAHGPCRVVTLSSMPAAQLSSSLLSVGRLRARRREIRRLQGEQTRSLLQQEALLGGLEQPEARP